MSNAAPIAPEMHRAFVASLNAYKPWHTPKWHSTGNDAFPHIISGALKTGFLTATKAENDLGVSSANLSNWEQGKDIPERKMRINVWKYLRKQAGMSAQQP